MSSIPTVPGSEIDVNTPVGAVRRSPAVAGDIMRGGQALARGISDVGEFAAQVEDNIQKARELGIAADVDLKLRTARQTFLENLKNSGDETKWSQSASELAQTTQESILSQDHVPPGMRPQINSAFKAWQGSLLTETQALANQQTINRAWGRVQADYSESLKDGHADHAAALIEQARARKLTDPAALDQMERDIPKVIAQNAIETGIGNNAHGTVQMLESGAAIPFSDHNGKPIFPKKALDARTFDTLLKQAKEAEAGKQTEFYGQVLGDYEADPAHPPTSDDFKTWVDTGQMSARSAKQMQGMIYQTQQRDVKARAAELNEKKNDIMWQIERYDLKADQAPKQTVQRWVDEASSLPPQYAKPILAMAQNKLASVNRTEAAEQKPAEAAVYRKIEEITSLAVAKPQTPVPGTPAVSAVHHYFFGADEPAKAAGPVTFVDYNGPITGERNENNPPIDKMTPAEIEANFGKGVKKEEVLAAINGYQAHLADQMRTWFATQDPKKPPTEEQAMAHLSELEKPYNMAMVKNKLKPAEAPQMSAADKRLVDWANKHPNDPRVQQVYARALANMGAGNP